MNIVLATDNGYIQHCAVTMTSIVCHNQNVNFYIVTESLSEENKKILINRFVLPNEVATLVSFLVSDEASAINNQVIVIDGGTY